MLSTAGVAFTSSNILKAVEKMERLCGSDSLGHRLRVPDSKQDEIQRLSSSVLLQRKLLIQYWMERDPRASWRGLIVALDLMGDKRTADQIRHLAESLTGRANSYNYRGSMDVRFLTKTRLLS